MSTPNLVGQKLLFVGPYAPPYGGIASLLKTLLPSLKASGADTVVALSFSKYQKVEHIDNCIILRVNLQKNFWKLFNPFCFRIIFTCLLSLGKYRIPFRDFIKACLKSIIIDETCQRYNLSTVSFYHAYESICILPLNSHWKFSRKIFLTVFGEIYEEATSAFMYRYKHLIHKVLSSCSEVIASSKHCADSFKLLGIDIPINVIFIGVDTSLQSTFEERIAARDDISISRTSVVIFFMGRMTKSMGFHNMLSLVNPILSISSDTHLLLAGATGDLTSQAFQIEKNYPGRITVLENVSYTLKNTLYLASDIVVAPSFNQRACMGVSIKEGMAASLPIIAASGGGIPEAVVDDNTGILIPVLPSGDIDSQFFLDAITKLVNSRSLRESFGSRGRQRALELFTLDSANSKFANLLIK